MPMTPLPPTSRWGAYLFAPMALAGLCGLLLPIWLTPQHGAGFYGNTLPWFGIGASVVAFFVGHFSYPRVHNLKVYLAGYLAGITGLAWFVLVDPPWTMDLPGRGADVGTFLQMLTFANLLTVMLVPSFVRYQVTKGVTLAVTAAEACVIVVLRFVPDMVSWARFVEFRHVLDPWFWVGPVWLTAVIALSVRFLRGEFHLGGVLAGTACLHFLAWTCPAVLGAGPAHAAQTLLLAAAPLALEIGIVIHWFLRIEHRVSYDPLLHIYNRNYCSRVIAEQSKLNTSPPFTVAMVDIDHFKQVNDTYGHQAGDAVLVNTAQTICREVVPDGVVCRYGGEEMVVFFPRATTKDIQEIMEGVRQEVEKVTTVVRKKKIKVTVSIGISQREERGQTIMDVIHAADKALYRAKEGGRNQVRTGKTSAPGAKKKGKDEEE